MIVLSMPGAESAAESLAGRRGRIGAVEVHRFPDGESRVRLTHGVKGEHVVLYAHLDRPDQKLLPLLFAAATARDLGAASIGLVAPYLPYLRQDDRFHVGEGVSARYFTALLSRAFDWLVTVDPHLHRIRSLAELFTIATRNVHAAPLLADWIRDHVARPLVLGPDTESGQWVTSVARLAGAPHAVFTKRRTGDRQVQLTVPALAGHAGRQPVLVDDVISSGATMAEAARLLVSQGWPAPVCLAIHAVFGEGAAVALHEAGVNTVVTTNTIPHPSNDIDVDPLLAEVVPWQLRPRRAWGAMR
jgi:ribose-phosphate pyrophosphokinase